MIEPITSLQNAFRLDGKNAVVTGGNGGLGLGRYEDLEGRYDLRQG